jgi:hypothetical protein
MMVAPAAEDVLGERRARVDLAAFLAVALAERLERDQPTVEFLTADPERMLLRLVRAGDEAVDRHRDGQLQLAHRSSLLDMLVRPPSTSEVIARIRSKRKLATTRSMQPSAPGRAGVRTYSGSVSPVRSPLVERNACHESPLHCSFFT